MRYQTFDSGNGETPWQVFDLQTNEIVVEFVAKHTAVAYVGALNRGEVAATRKS